MNKYFAWGVLIVLPTVIFSCNQKLKNKGVPSQIAEAYGFKEFSKVKSIEFTFNFQKDSVHVERHWKWTPETNTVVFYEKGDSTSFKRMDTSTVALRKLNAQFTNDEYWLVFPLHLQWDEGYTFTDNDTATGPVTGKQYHKYTIQYNGTDGFTPGDMYEIYTDDKYVLHEWSYHKSGAQAPSLMMSWEDYGDFGGLIISKKHANPEKNTMIYFTGIAIAKLNSQSN